MACRRGTRWTTAFLLLAVVLSPPGLMPQAPETGLAARSAALAKADGLMKQGQNQAALKTLLDLDRAYPNDAEISQQIGNAYVSVRELQPAADFFQKALKLDPARVVARKNLGVVLWFLDRKKDSEREFLSVAKQTPQDPIPHLYLGLAAFERKQYGDAKNHFRQAGDAATRNPEALPAVLESYLATGDSSLNAGLLKMIESAGNPDPELIFRIGSVFGSHGAYDEAVRAFTKIKAVYGDRYALLSSLAKAQLQSGHPAEAEKTAQEIVQAGLSKPEVYLILGESYDKQNRPDDAYKAFTKAIDLAPDDETGYLEVAKFASAHQNNDYALKILDQGLQHKPSSASLLMQRGLVYALQGRAQQAEAGFAEASRAAPQWMPPLLALGVSQLEAGKWDDAAKTFAQAHTVDPADYRAPYLYAEAITRSDRAERLPEVVENLKKAIALNPRDPKPHVSMAAAHQSAGRKQEAVAELERALKLDPENSAALYRLSRAYNDLGRTADAQRSLQRFQELKAKSREEEKSELVQRLTIVRE